MNNYIILTYYLLLFSHKPYLQELTYTPVIQTAVEFYLARVTGNTDGHNKKPVLTIP